MSLKLKPPWMRRRFLPQVTERPRKSFTQAQAKELNMLKSLLLTTLAAAAVIAAGIKVQAQP